MTAAYASLISLRTLIDQIQSHPRPPITLHKHHVESLCKNISFLQEFLETYCQDAIEESTQGLVRRIAEVAYAASDKIESHIADLIEGGSTSHQTDIDPQPMDLHEVIRSMSFVMEEVTNVEKKFQGEDGQLQQRLVSDSNPERVLSFGLKSTAMVGHDDVFYKVLEKLTGYPSSLQIIPVGGMGGIGKTTLAFNAYEHHGIVQHFDIRSWAVVSQDNNVQDILLKLLDEKKDTNMGEKELKEKLHKRLYGRRYLIVLDDMWSAEMWNKIKHCFPDNNNRSRIIVTTRIFDVASKLSEDTIIEMNFLDEQNSWNLLCSVVFGKEVCPTELEGSGRKIARDCKGLPLSIVVMGGLLAKSEQTQAYWGFIANKLNSSMFVEHKQHCSHILRTSFDYMPIHLKPCFLFMGVFPEDCEIKVHDLIKGWVAEGFVKPISGKSLEFAAEECLMDLIDRNLILVRRIRSIGKIKVCTLHDVTRDFCIKEAEKEEFLCTVREYNSGTQQGIDVQRRIAIHASTMKDGILHQALDALQPSLVHSMVCDSVFPQFSRWSSLRMLNVIHCLYCGYDWRKHTTLFIEKYINRSINLRFFAMKSGAASSFPPSMYRLWNLQTLILSDTVITTPLDIWKMHGLKCVKIGLLYLPTAPQGVHDDDHVLWSLQTLCTVVNFWCSEEVVKRIPSVRKLKIQIHLLSLEQILECCLNNLRHLQKLKSLTLFYGPHYTARHVSLMQIIAFPHSLVNLNLVSTCLCWEEITSEIGSLPHLEKLTLKSAVQGPVWNLVKGKFQHLRCLVIQDTDLKCWTAESDHFPCLEHLSLRFLRKLKGIPSEVGDAPKLQSIELKACVDSIVKSAQRIVDEQEDLGNSGLKVRVYHNMQDQHYIELLPHAYVPEEVLLGEYV